MQPEVLERIYQFFALNPSAWHCVPFGSGLINTTWVLKEANEEPAYILQKINHQVFKKPEDIAYNIRLIGNYLAQHYPGYLFTYPLASVAGGDLFKSDNGDYYRIFPFIRNSKSLDVVAYPEQAGEAARHFARFSKLLGGLDATLLKESLPRFHDLSLRYEQFDAALHNTSKDRRKKSAAVIQWLQEHYFYVETYLNLTRQKDFPIRVMHHDTKISNILFDKDDHGLCVIDLDTVMPGYFISDVGDMMRTYLSPASEEEEDFSKVVVRPQYFEAIVNGYLGEMGDQLTALEKKQFLYAGQFIIYMQALRFLTDYLNHDIYYGARYEGHNLVRAQNQVKLLQSLNEQSTILNAMLEKALSQKAPAA